MIDIFFVTKYTIASNKRPSLKRQKFDEKTTLAEMLKFAEKYAQLHQKLGPVREVLIVARQDVRAKKRTGVEIDFEETVTKPKRKVRSSVPA